MGGFFGIASKQDCMVEVFFGVDYHSHLGTRRAGMAVYGENGFDRAIHNIQNSPFRTKFENDLGSLLKHANVNIICSTRNKKGIFNSIHIKKFNTNII